MKPTEKKQQFQKKCILPLRKLELHNLKITEARARNGYFKRVFTSTITEIVSLHKKKKKKGISGFLKKL